MPDETKIIPEWQADRWRLLDKDDDGDVIRCREVTRTEKGFIISVSDECAGVQVILPPMDTLEDAQRVATNLFFEFHDVMRALKE